MYERQNEISFVEYQQRNGSIRCVHLLKESEIMKKVALLTALIMLISSFGIVLAACNPNPDSTYVAIDINPSVEMVVENDKVVTLRAKNHDAQVMLYGTTDIVGKSVEQASKQIAELAYKYNYIANAQGTIGLTVLGENDQLAAQIQAEVSAGLSGSFDEHSLDIAITTDGALSYSSQLAALKEQYPDNQAVQQLTDSEYRLICSVSIDGSFDFEGFTNFDFDALMEELKETHEYYKDKLDDQFEMAVLKAEEVYNAAVDGLMQLAYVGVDAVRGAQYVALKTAYYSLEYIQKVQSGLQQLIVLTDEQAQQIAQALEMTEEQLNQFLTAVKNEDGEITLEGVEAYFNTLYRGLTDEQKAQFDKVWGGAFELIQSIKEANSALTEEVKQTINSIIDKLTEAGLTIEGGIEDIKDLDTLIAKTESKLNELQQYFDELPNNKKQEIEQYKKTIQSLLENAEAVMYKAINTARELAQERLLQEQQYRLTLTIQ